MIKKIYFGQACKCNKKRRIFELSPIFHGGDDVCTVDRILTQTSTQLLIRLSLLF